MRQVSAVSTGAGNAEHAIAGRRKYPFTFHFDKSTFKVGVMVCYRVESLDDFPFVGTVISPNDPSHPRRRMTGTRESRPRVARAEAID
jgi:hypothetical protein